MTIGSNIAKLRKQRNWTQAELAERTNLSQGYIAAIEENRVKPTIKAKAVIAHILGVGLKNLCGEDGEHK